MKFWAAPLALFGCRAIERPSHEAGSAAEKVLGAAGKLTKHSTLLRNEVDRFLVTVRAA